VRRRNIACGTCESADAAADSAAPQLSVLTRFLHASRSPLRSKTLLRNLTMTRSPRAAGFDSHSTRVASTRLNDTVAAALAIGSLSLCLIVTLTVFSIKVSMAMPIPA